MRAAHRALTARCRRLSGGRPFLSTPSPVSAPPPPIAFVRTPPDAHPSPFFRAEDVSTSHAATRAHRNQLLHLFLSLFCLFVSSTVPDPQSSPRPPPHRDARPRRLPRRAPERVEFSSSRVVGRVRDVYAYPLKGARGHRLDEATLARRFRRPGRPRVRAHATRQGGRVVDDDGKGSRGKGRASVDDDEGRDPGHHGNKHLFHQSITDPSMSRVEARASAREE